LFLWLRGDVGAVAEAPAADDTDPGGEPFTPRDEAEPPLRASRDPIPRPELRAAGDGIPIMAARDDSSANGRRHPHPVTEEHQRIFGENSVIGSLNGAMDVEDFEGLRRLNEQYKKEYPEDPHRLQSGYDLIADCLEQPTPENRNRAERYFKEERASTLRRYVKRYCLK
jgi:hypothetical protein